MSFILCVLEPGKEAEVLKDLRSLEEVKEAYVVYGEFDIHARIEVENLEKLGDFNEKLRKVKGILHTETLIATIY